MLKKTMNKVLRTVHVRPASAVLGQFDSLRMRYFVYDKIHKFLT